MYKLEAELQTAREELAFWRDFTRWWQGRHTEQVEPRIFEILSDAERRCTRAEQALLQTQRIGAIN